MSTTQDPLSKAERLAIGGAVAPVVRRRADAPRKVTLVGKDGKPTGVTTDVEVAKSLLARSEIEFSVQPGKRPEFVKCETRGRPVKVDASCSRLPTTCRRGTHKCPCGAPVGDRGKCGFGKQCRACRTREMGRVSGGHGRKVSDDQVRDAISATKSLREAARLLGISITTMCTRARSLKKLAHTEAA